MKRYDYIGFHKLRPGRIHAFCPRCGRKYSNLPREPYDPPEAVLMHIVCDRCGHGCKVDGPDMYLTADGRKVFAQVC